MVSNKWMLLFVIGLAYTSGFPAEDLPLASSPQDTFNSIESGIDNARSFVQSCGDKELMSCLKMRALTYVDRIVRKSSLDIVDGVSLVKTGEPEEVSRVLNGRALTEEELDATLQGDAQEKDAQVESLLVDRVARFLENFTIQLKMPESAISEVRKSLDEARGKKKKKIKMLLPLLLLLKLKAAALIPLALGGLALLALKALLVGKLALLLAGIIALKKLLSKNQHSQTYEVVAHPHYSHSHVSSYGDEHGHGGHYGRALPEQDAHQLAYAAYAGAETKQE